MKKLLLHSCCAPCSTSVIERLKNEYKITLFFTNSNIFPKNEFHKRLQEQIRCAKIYGIEVLIDDYLEDDFLKAIKGFELEKEGGERCDKCFEFRLLRTAQVAKEKKFDVFASTLSVSPHKNSEKINRTGKQISIKTGVEFLAESFKKQDGYKKSIELSRKFDLYRQDYCGCRFSIRNEENNV